MNFVIFVKKNMKITGVLTHCTSIFDKLKKPQCITERLMPGPP